MWLCVGAGKGRGAAGHEAWRKQSRGRESDFVSRGGDSLRGDHLAARRSFMMYAMPRSFRTTPLMCTSPGTPVPPTIGRRWWGAGEDFC